MLAIIGQQAVAVFAKSRAGTVHNVLRLERWRTAAFDVHWPTVRKALQGNLFDGACPKVASQARIVQYGPMACINAMMCVTPPRSDEMSAYGWLQRRTRYV
jgi:hypothetical protein